VLDADRWLIHTTASIGDWVAMSTMGFRPIIELNFEKKGSYDDPE
jgi:hypothetical protein